MKFDFNEFLRVMTVVLIFLLVFQGMDYIFGYGVNNYIFIVFCIVFAFTLGCIYHNIIVNEKSEKQDVVDEDINGKLDEIQRDIAEEYERDGLTDSVLDKQVELNTVRSVLDIPDESEVVNDEGFVQ